MANEKVCRGKKVIPKLRQQMLNNARKKTAIFIDRCNITENSTGTASYRDMETDIDSNFNSMNIVTVTSIYRNNVKLCN